MKCEYCREEIYKVGDTWYDRTRPEVSYYTSFCTNNGAGKHHKLDKESNIKRLLEQVK